MGDRPQPWRPWYKTPRWQALRCVIFKRDHGLCRRCRKPADPAICDHIEPHRGDERLFFDAGNLQTLCKPCHDGAKQAQEQASLHTRGVWY